MGKRPFAQYSRPPSSAAFGKRIQLQQLPDRYFTRQYKYSIADAVIFINGLTKMGFSNSDTVAYVTSKDKKEKSFWETTALNRGWKRLAYFTEGAEAEKWLKDPATR